MDAAVKRKTIYVGGLADSVTSDSLYSAFLPFGEIVEVQLPPDPATRDESGHRGFGFVEYADANDAWDAIDNMHLAVLAGNVLKVNLAKPLKSTINQANSNKPIWQNAEWIEAHSLKKEEDADKPAGTEAKA